MVHGENFYKCTKMAVPPIIQTGSYGVNLSAHIVSIYLIRNRIKRLFNETLTPTPVASSVGGEVIGLERVYE